MFAETTVGSSGRVTAQRYHYQLQSGFMLMIGQGSAVWFLDIPSLIIILLFDSMMLISAGLTRDFNNAFRMAFANGKEKGLSEIKRAIEAVVLVRKTTLTAGGFGMIFGLIMVIVIGQLANLELLGPNLAVASLTLLYALAIELVLLPLESRLKMKLQSLLQD